MKKTSEKKITPPISPISKLLFKDKSARIVVNDNRRVFFVSLLLAIATVLVYSDVLKNDFLFYDDSDYVTMNRHIQQGVTWQGISWAFTSTYASNWHPLTWISHMLDVQLFGLNPAGHHFTNLFLHVLAALFLFGFLRYATGKLWTSAIVGALFSLHPLHVESVAWVAERKDVLSATFWFSTLWAYVYYTRSPNKRKYALVLILFAFGLLAKPMLVSLPFILLLLDYWPLERLTLNKQSLGRLIAEKLPLLFMAVASATITIIAQREAIGDLNRINFLSRISNAALSYCVYLKQVILPTKLAIFYPYILHPGLLNVLMCTVFLVVSTALVLWLGRRNKYLMTGWFWFIVTLVPVIGIMQVGDQSHADRYTYIPFVGIFILIVFGLNTIANKMQKSKKSIVKIAIVFIIIALSVKTWEQVGYWKNDFTLFSHAIEVTKNNYIAYNNLGYQFELTERNNEAIELYKKALDINPKFGEAHYNLGNMLLQTGRADEAISHYKKALEINPNKIDALSNLAGAYFQTNQLKEAMLLMQRALEMAKVAGDESQVKKSIENIELLNQAMGLSQKP